MKNLPEGAASRDSRNNWRQQRMVCRAKQDNVYRMKLETDYFMRRNSNQVLINWIDASKEIGLKEGVYMKRTMTDQLDRVKKITLSGDDI